MEEDPNNPYGVKYLLSDPKFIEEGKIHRLKDIPMHAVPESAYILLRKKLVESFNLGEITVDEGLKKLEDLENCFKGNYRNREEFIKEVKKVRKALKNEEISAEAAICQLTALQRL